MRLRLYDFDDKQDLAVCKDVSGRVMRIAEISYIIFLIMGLVFLRMCRYKQR